MSPELVVVGNLIADDIVYEDGSTRFGQAGGAALYTALGASLWGIEVGVGSVIGNDYPPLMLDSLGERGIDLAGVRRRPGPGMRTWLLYEGRRRQVVHRLDSPSHAEMSPRPEDLPADWRPVAVHLAPMPLTVQDAWLDWLDWLERIDGGLSLSSLDPYELIGTNSLDRCRRTFQRADILLLSEDELLLEAALDNPSTELRALAQSSDGTVGRLRHVVLKRGARGGLAYDSASETLIDWPASRGEVVEGTGAGDAFAGGMMAGLLRDLPLAGALHQGAVSASLALSGQGASGLLASNEAEARARLADWFGTDRVA